MSEEIARLKQQAAARAVESVESGMIVGLGAGSTAFWAVRQIGERLQAGELRDIKGVPASPQTENQARQLGIPLTTLDDHPLIHLTIDGADEVDPHLNLIKGGGGALLREKIIAEASQREIIIVDNSKLSDALGTRWAVPVEVVPFGWQVQADYLATLGAQVTVRRKADGDFFTTAQGNLILDCDFGPITHLTDLATQIKCRTGIVEHGLFLGLATEVIVASVEGIRQLQYGER